MHKTMSYEISQMTWTPLGRFGDDEKACCNSMNMVLALMLCQKHGVPQSACIMAAMALIKVSYSMKTGFSISKGTYSSTKFQPTHGPGRGSQLASTLWMIFSCMLFLLLMAKLYHRASFCNPRNKLVHRQTSNGFVNDVRSFCKVSKEKDNHGNDCFGPLVVSLTYQNVCTTFSSPSLNPMTCLAWNLYPTWAMISLLSSTPGKNRFPLKPRTLTGSQ